MNTAKLLKDASWHLDKLISIFEELNSELTDLNGELSDATNKIDDLEWENRNLQERISQMQNELGRI